MSATNFKDFAPKAAKKPIDIEPIQEEEQQPELPNRSPDVIKFDTAGLRKLEIKKSSMHADGESISFEKSTGFRKMQNVSELLQ